MQQNVLEGFVEEYMNDAVYGRYIKSVEQCDLGVVEWFYKGKRGELQLAGYGGLYVRLFSRLPRELHIPPTFQGTEVYIQVK